jgi:two-component system cell cycle response regulator
MTGRVLLIEDDVPSMELMFHLLTTYGYFPIRARNPEQGYKLAAQHLPDLIVSDISVPFIDGCEIARRIKADPQLKGIPMIALTAFAMAEDRRKALAAGFDGYMSKPIAPESFVRHIEAFLHPEYSVNTEIPDAAAKDAAAIVGRRKVLVVDDTPANLKLAVLLLTNAGYQVATASGLGEALRLARRDPPDLILSDIVMADGSGYEFIRAVKNDGRLRAIPFVFNTASMTVDTARAKCLALGAVKVLFRPMDPAQVLREIAACFATSAPGI